MVKKLFTDNIEKIPEQNFEHFEKSLDDLIGFCHIIEKQNKINQRLIRNSISVRLVSIIEFYAKASISSLINKYDLDPKRILNQYEITIDLDILNHMKSDQYSKGRMVVAHLNNMNPRIIDDVMSRINKLDFFRWYESIKGTSTIGEFYPLFQNIYSTRNDIVHNLIDSEESEKEFIKKIQALRIFTFDLFWLSVANIRLFDKKMDDTKIEMILEVVIPGKSSSVALNHFKKTTKKFRDEFSPKTRRY